MTPRSFLRSLVVAVATSFAYVAVVVVGLYLLGIRVVFLTGAEPAWVAWLGLLGILFLATLAERTVGTKLRPWSRRRRASLEFVGGPLDGKFAAAFIDAAGATPVLESDEFDGPEGTFKYRLAYVGDREVLEYVGPL